MGEAQDTLVTSVVVSFHTDQIADVHIALHRGRVLFTKNADGSITVHTVFPGFIFAHKDAEQGAPMMFAIETGKINVDGKSSDQFWAFMLRDVFKSIRCKGDLTFFENSLWIFLSIMFAARRDAAQMEPRLYPERLTQKSKRGNKLEFREDWKDLIPDCLLLWQAEGFLVYAGSKSLLDVITPGSPAEETLEKARRKTWSRKSDASVNPAWEPFTFVEVQQKWNQLREEECIADALEEKKDPEEVKEVESVDVDLSERSSQLCLW